MSLRSSPKGYFSTLGKMVGSFRSVLLAVITADSYHNSLCGCPQLRGSHKRAWSLRFAMISRDTIALIDTDSVTLELCRIVEDPDTGTPSLRILVRLGLPPLASGAFIRYSYCIRKNVPVYSDAPPFVVEGRPPRRLPFHSSPEDGIVAIVFAIKVCGFLPMTQPVTIVTHLRTLVAHATTVSPDVSFIPWRDWGPSVTACFNHPVSPQCDALVGERWATLSSGTLTLYDFNSMRIQDTIRGTGYSSQRGVRARVVKHKTVIPRGRLFKEDIVSELPFISVVRPAPLGWKSPVIYEERVAGVSLDVSGRLFLPLFSRVSGTD